MTDTVRERTVREPKLLLPVLHSFYERVVPLAWPIARLACGFHLIVHGWGKILRGGTVTGSTLAFGIFLTFIEFVASASRSDCSRASSPPRSRSRWPT